MWKDAGIYPGKTLIKRYLSEQKCGCWNCGIVDWMNMPIVLELEHIDGNAYNNSIDNLSLLCPNCHSQTPTYKGKNMGNGRVERRERAKKDYHRTLDN
jgi:Zn finger protein HypA/HybF involved in hydrogenase expression